MEDWHGIYVPLHLYETSRLLWFTTEDTYIYYTLRFLTSHTHIFLNKEKWEGGDGCAVLAALTLPECRIWLHSFPDRGSKIAFLTRLMIHTYIYHQLLNIESLGPLLGVRKGNIQFGEYAAVSSLPRAANGPRIHACCLLFIIIYFSLLHYSISMLSFRLSSFNLLFPLLSSLTISLICLFCLCYFEH